jgi:hypothetical protein
VTVGTLGVEGGRGAHDFEVPVGVRGSNGGGGGGGVATAIIILTALAFNTNVFNMPRLQIKFTHAYSMIFTYDQALPALLT